MSSKLLPFAVILLLAACDGAALVGSSGEGTDGETDGGGDGVSGEVPAALAVNMHSFAYDGTSLEVAIEGGDSNPELVQYDRAAALDLPGYSAYSIQEDALDRLYVALVATSQDGSVTAIAAGDGGLDNRYYAGGLYHREGQFDRPEIGANGLGGLVSYAGTYAAVTNVDARQEGGADDIALPVAPGTDPVVIPAQPSRVEGDIYLTADFGADNVVSGSIYDRSLVDEGIPLPNVILVPTSINDDGTFEGGAEDEGQNAIGSYGGIFGGNDAQSVGGIVHLTQFSDLYENEQEHGVFVLTQCGPNNTLPICDNVLP
ncbi:thymidylate synthase [Pseudothioclava nitratireducens]|uniref:thymidylate synthase n=1 Tax=Pseudothioclava nitratireducens TaxID=1928646 RepID=UPI0023DB8245|nr:thymidylate synthase [Defluviimonas nitratireducens]MDF1620978.1 thymidylate synthase [Defluviimonas nitratireducens]